MFLTKQYTIAKRKVEPKVEMEEDLPKPYPKPPPKKMRGAGLDELISKIKDVTLKEPKRTSKITF
jgi:hypothetical protein